MTIPRPVLIGADVLGPRAARAWLSAPKGVGFLRGRGTGHGVGSVFICVPGSCCGTVAIGGQQRVKTVAPGGIKADFAGRSLVLTQHPAYVEMVPKVFNAFSDPARRAAGSSSEQIAEVVWEASTDNQDKLTYVVGADAE